MQSRYYDPELGRFLNADAYASTGQGLLGCNMYVYCLNNPMIFTDYDGCDAVILYKEDGVGHIGLLIEDEDGTWWHFYWGANGLLAVFFSLLSMDVERITWLKEFDGDPNSLDEINNSGQYDGTYVDSHYLEGDFTDALNEIKNLSDKYNLYNNNCGQVSMRILASADTNYSDMLAEAAELWTPKEINVFISGNISKHRPHGGSSSRAFCYVYS